MTPTILRRLNNLNGWQRLWLVLSVLGLLYATGWGYLRGVNATQPGYEARQEVIDGYSLPECRPVMTLPPGFELEELPDAACIPLYHYRLLWEGKAASADEYRRDMEGRRFRVIIEWVLGGFILWATSVITAYFIGWALAWVRRGFRSKS